MGKTGQLCLKSNTSEPVISWGWAFGVAQIPAYAMLDAQVSYTFDELYTTVKIGGSNVMNDWYTTSYGSASIGGLYYVTLVFDGLKE